MGVRLVRASVAGKVLEGKHFFHWNSRLVDVLGVDAHMQMLINDNERETVAGSLGLAELGKRLKLH